MVFSLGWNGSNRHWMNYEKAYMILAAIATPLVLSFTQLLALILQHLTYQVGILLFSPYFVAGAVFFDLRWY